MQWIITSAGLTESELEELARLGSKAQKTARRDIAHVVRALPFKVVDLSMFAASKCLFTNI